MRSPQLALRNDTLSSNIDLYPSLLAFLRQPIPPDLPGRSIFDSQPRRFVLSQSGQEWAVIKGWEKLIVKPHQGQFLFDLEFDPRETSDLAESRPERVATLTALGEAVRAGASHQRAQETETELSPEAIETLRSLGYLD